MKQVTIEMLKDSGAVSSEVELFKTMFGQSAELTKDDIVKASQAGLELHYFAPCFLSAPARQIYDEAAEDLWRSYEEATEAAERSYEEAIEAAERSYEEAVASALWAALKVENGE